jgi:peptidoglycan/xylan/chitin deacetylase (PgdA/CDA1 family)
MPSGIQPLVTEVFDRLGLVAALRRAAARFGGVILRLNRVLPRDERSLCFDPSLVVSETTFVSLLELLTAKYAVVPLEELLARPGSREKRPRVALTFDDGWEDTYRIVFPHLLTSRIPVTLFVCSSLIDSGQALPEERFSRLWNQATARGGLDDLIVDLSHWGLGRSATAATRRQKRYWTQELKEMPLTGRLLLLEYLERQYEIARVPTRRFVTWRELNVMVQTGLVQVGTHTAGHATLTSESDRDIRQELEDSRHSIWSHTGLRVDAVSYPNGAYNRRVMDVVRSTGLRYGLTGIPGWVTRRTLPLAVPRIAVRSAVERMAAARGEMEFAPGRTTVYFLSSWLSAGTTGTEGSSPRA